MLQVHRTAKVAATVGAVVHNSHMHNLLCVSQVLIVPYPLSGVHAQCILHTRVRTLGGCVASLGTLRARVKRLQSKGQELLWHDFT